MYEIFFDTGNEILTEKEFDDLIDYWIFWGFSFPFLWVKV